MNKQDKLKILQKESDIWCSPERCMKKDRKYTGVILFELVKCGRIDCINRQDCCRVHKNGTFTKANIKISMIHGSNTDIVIYCDSFEAGE
jgi:putative heme degradation protein